jgi:hypothetical protein
MAIKKTSRKKTKKKAAGKKSHPRNKLAAKRPAPKKKQPAKKASRKKRRIRGKSQGENTVVFEPKGLGARSAGQSGDLQGLSGIAGAASESVEELLEEGNAFEAEVVKGVEDAGNPDEGELTTREVPEDDIPEEYLEDK